MVRIYANNGFGKIERLFVKNGEVVSIDQPLAQITTEKVLSDGTNLEESLNLQYEQQQRLIESQIQRTKDIFKLKQQNNQQQLSSAQLDLATIKKQAETLNLRLALVQARLESLTVMHENGNASLADKSRAEEELLEITSEVQQAKRNRFNQQSQIQQLEAQLVLLPNELQNELDELNRNVAELSRQRIQLKGQQTYVIKATKAGIVTNLQSSVGQQTSANSPLLSIIPEDANMEGNILVPVRAAGFIIKGQQVDIRYDAFPYQKFGLFKGSVQQVSQQILLPNETGLFPIQTQEPVYLVKANLDSKIESTLGNALPLKPGMTFSADIKLSDRTLLEWLFEPIVSLKGEL